MTSDLRHEGTRYQCPCREADMEYRTNQSQILHLDFKSERQRWEAELEKSAPSLDSSDFEEDEEDLPVFSGQQAASQPFTIFHNDEPTSDARTSDEADAVLEQEDRELEALLALMEDEHDVLMDQEASQHFGSDDEDYDSLFMDLVPESKTGKDQGNMTMDDQVPDEIMDES